MRFAQVVHSQNSSVTIIAELDAVVVIPDENVLMETAHLIGVLENVSQKYSARLVIITGMNYIAVVQTLLKWNGVRKYFCLSCKMKLYVSTTQETGPAVSRSGPTLLDFYTLSANHSRVILSPVQFGQSYVGRRRNLKQVRGHAAHVVSFRFSFSSWQLNSPHFALAEKMEHQGELKL